MLTHDNVNCLVLIHKIWMFLQQTSKSINTCQTKCIVIFFEDVSTAFVCASHSKNPTGVTPEILAKVCRIDIATAKCTINVITPVARQDVNISHSRNFGMNDIMLRYRQIVSFFYKYCFFVKKKKGHQKAMRTLGFTFMQLFVSDKGYVFVVPMHNASEFFKCSSIFCTRGRSSNVFDSRTIS